MKKIEIGVFVIVVLIIHPILMSFLVNYSFEFRLLVSVLLGILTAFIIDKLIN